MIRPIMQLGWFMSYALGAMHIRDNGHVVVKAWCADTEDGVFVGHRASGMTDAILDVDHEHGTVTVGASRYAGKRVTLQDQADAIEQAHSHFKAGEKVELIQCPMCQKFVAKQEIQGSYPYECCNQCYWELDA